MNTAQTVCNYALLQFLPYPETGEFVNVGVLVACMQPCLLQFQAGETMPPRASTLFPRQHKQTYAQAMAALRTDMERAQSSVRDPKTCQLVFGELVRRRESIFRFGDVRTILTNDPHHLADDLFRRYVLQEAPKQPQSSLVAA